MKILSLIILLIVAPGLVVAGPLSVFVSVLPQKYFVEQIGGEHVAVQVLVGPGQSPTTFEPKPRQMSALAGADLYYRIGVPFEQILMPRIQSINPSLAILDARGGIVLREIGPGHRHHPDEASMDPHVWLDPVRVRAMLEPLRDRLIRLDPQNRLDYQRNYARFINQLQLLEQDIRGQFARTGTKTFMVYHPSWGYFADTFGLQQIAIEFEGKSPGARRLVGLIEQARKDKINAIFVQPQFASNQAKALAQAVGVPVVLLDPLAEDYLNNMKLVAQAISGSDNE